MKEIPATHVERTRPRAGARARFSLTPVRIDSNENSDARYRSPCFSFCCISRIGLIFLLFERYVTSERSLKLQVTSRQRLVTSSYKSLKNPIRSG